MTKDINTYRELIPEYLNDRLDVDARMDFEKNLRGNEALERELAEFKTLKKSYAGMSEKIPGPPPDAFSKIMKKIEHLEETEAENRLDISAVKTGFSRWVEIILDWAAVPRTAWAVAAVQMTIIIALAVVLISGPSNRSYETLSAGSIQSKSEIYINVVFKHTAMEEDIRNLLTGIPANIVDGPSETGLYVIAISSEQAVDQVILKLQNAGVVKFVQKKI